MLIRLATAADAAEIAELSRRTFFDTFAAFNTPENMEMFMRESFSREALMKEVDEPGNIFLVVQMDGELVAYARLSLSTNPPELGDAESMEIVRIYADKKVIGKGVGNSLMQECIELAKSYRKDIVWLGVWEHNQRAIDFYIKCGFEKFGEHVFLLGEDVQNDYLMKKIIGFREPRNKNGG